MENEQILPQIQQLLNDNPEAFPRNDIGTSRLFYRCFENKIVYVLEPKCWYIYKDSYWIKDDGNLLIMEIIKKFVISYTKYALSLANDEYIKFTTKLCSRSRRESIIKDACSIAPKSLSIFDDSLYLFFVFSRAFSCFFDKF